jgi:hypothetical protein
MPIEHGAGHSEYTAIKQRDFEKVLSTFLRVARSPRCMGQHWAHKEYLYFDLNAGPGYVNGIEGSPLIFARRALTERVPFREILFEADNDNVGRLSDALCNLCASRGVSADRIQVVPGDHNKTVPWFIAEHLGSLPRGGCYGLAYGDGNGRDDSPFGPLAAIAERFSLVDLLVNVNSGIYKRVRGAHPDARFLENDLAGIDKKFSLIRKPAGQWGWTMVLMTNWANVPEFREIGFRRLDSEEGRRIFEQVNYSAREREAADSPLGQSQPTAPMPSTFVIPASSLSAPSSSSGVAASASAAGSLAQPSPTT